MSKASPDKDCDISGNVKGLWLVIRSIVHRPDITETVGWALKTNYRPTYLSSTCFVHRVEKIHIRFWKQKQALIKIIVIDDDVPFCIAVISMKVYTEKTSTCILATCMYNARIDETTLTKPHCHATIFRLNEKIRERCFCGHDRIFYLLLLVACGRLMWTTRKTMVSVCLVLRKMQPAATQPPAVTNSNVDSFWNIYHILCSSLYVRG